jgi:hypothetical protein
VGEKEKNMTKHCLKIFGPAGGTTVAEWEESDEAAVEIARGVFDQAKSEGFAAVTPAPGGAVAVDRFSPQLDETFLLRPIAGG